ncbi:MAG: efflux RND transporter periplasmic adaptor subunit [Candidatus Aminicenantes bacterium]|nr:MAG: efflux RND transporter periplasmic adaptor subunit [Candidatus Aminicenantes bacterium]
MIMKYRKYLALLGMGLILVACGPRSEEAQLARLEGQRDALTEEIEMLKQEIAQKARPGVKREKLMNVKISQVEKERFQHFIQVQGIVESDNNVLIAPQSSGIVKKIHVNAGNKVTKGQLLAELDGSILESSIAEVENGLKLAETIFERQQRLWDKNIGSEIEFLQARNNKVGMEKRLATLKEQYKTTKIFTPLSGTVDEILIKEGEMAVAGMGAVRVVQLSNLKIKVDLSEVYISRIKKNDFVHVKIPATGREFDLRVDAVSQVIDPQNRTFQIEMKIPKSEVGIKPNMLSVLTINDYTNDEALIVPLNIVQETGQEQFIFVAEQINGGWIAQRRSVKTGNSYIDRAEISSGLQEGEYVVTFGYQNLADGQKLAVVSGSK